MRSVLIISLLLSFSWQIGSCIAVYFCFKANQAHIIEHHCVNKDNPDMECDGHCHLTAMMINMDHNHDAPAPRKTSIVVKEIKIPLFLQKAISAFLTNLKPIDQVGFSPHSLTSVYCPDLLRPPQA